MTLIELLGGSPGPSGPAGRAAAATPIRGIAADSRAVQPGFLFAALPGRHIDGRQFIPDALARGAVAVLAPPGTALPAGAAADLVIDPQPRRRLALLAARFAGAQPRTIAAVTGTNGKTSVVWFLRQIWERLGRRAAGLGTLGIQAGEISRPGRLTTPDPVALHACLADLARQGIDHLALEASSHGLDQFRLDGVNITAAAFTNLSRDHLDYHGSMTAYRDAKLRLFRDLVAAGGTGVVNADAEHAGVFADAAAVRGLRVLSYGRHGETVRLDAVTPDPAGQHLHLSVCGTARIAAVPLVGEFQAANVLCALTLALATGVAAADALPALARLSAVPGRLERVGVRHNGAAVYVDYAHTPDALATVLAALRPHTPGRLWVVFGCGGDRDPGKRPAMGAIAAALADEIVITDDNPRSEDPADVRSQALAACPGAVEIGDRAEAIGFSVARLAPGDVLVVAGKGHETGQAVGEQVLPFDDRDQVRAALAGVGR